MGGKLMGSGVGTNPLAAIFAASNAGGIPSPAGIQQVAGLLQSHLAGGSINPSQLQHLMQQHSLMQSHHQLADAGRKQLEQLLHQLQEQLQINLLQQTHMLQQQHQNSSKENSDVENVIGNKIQRAEFG